MELELQLQLQLELELELELDLELVDWETRRLAGRTAAITQGASSRQTLRRCVSACAVPAEEQQHRHTPAMRCGPGPAPGTAVVLPWTKNLMAASVHAAAD